MRIPMSWATVLEPLHHGIGLLTDKGVKPLVTTVQINTLAHILEAGDPVAAVHELSQLDEIPLTDLTLLPPIDQQDVWAAGVTYKRSKTARMEESTTSASCYDRVYMADRPELFPKAYARCVAGPGMPLRIRRDATWSVPEPEVTLVINSRGQLVGFTVGNDMSSRDIEGENPLYLPQAKFINEGCGLGPCITLTPDMPSREDTKIEMNIRRDGNVVFNGAASADQMKRTYEELIEWLFRELSFPNGVFLLTGTCVVPPNDFTLWPGDVVEITIAGIGTLTNHIVQGSAV